MKSIYSNEYNEFVKKLKQARLDANIEQKEIAKIIGKSQSYISKIEKGQIRLDIIQLKHLSCIYKKDIFYFL